MKDKEYTEKRDSKRGLVLFLGTVCALLFVFARVLGAYWLKVSTNPDYTVVVLMARHIAQGIEFPLFFYGQSYMGSLEPMLSALLCRFVGFSGFTVCMGTVIFSFGMIPFVYLLGRNCGGWRAGIAALFFCAVGPGVFFHYSASPRGGYAALMFFTVFLLWALAEIIHREAAGASPRSWIYFLVGIVSGIAWWVNPLITPVFLAGAGCYLIYTGRNTFGRKGPYAALAGLLTGLLPFIVWNAQHDWQSFRMVTDTTRVVDFSKGLRLFFVRGASLLDFGRLGVWATLLFAPVYAGAVVIFVSRTVKGFRKDRNAGSSVFLFMLSLYTCIYAVCFAVSDFAHVDTPVYLLPLVPVTGCFLGVALVSFSPKRRWIPLVILAALFVLQLSRLPVFIERRDRSLEMVSRAEALSTYLVKNEIEDIYAVPADQYLNYVLSERFVFCNTDRERYPPYLEKLEYSENPAVLNGRNEFSDFLKAHGAEYTRGKVEGFTVFHNVKRNHGFGQGLDPAEVLSVKSPDERDLKGALFDRTLVTGWSAADSSDGSAADLRILLSSPVPVTGLRFLCRPQTYPYTWILYGRADPEDEWMTLIDEVAVSPYFWSGTRFFARGTFFRAEGSFPPVICNELRVVFPSMRSGGMRLSELDIRVAGAGGGEPEEMMDALAVWLERKGTGKVYADRWEGNQLARRCDVDVIRDRSFRSSDNAEGLPVSPTGDTAFVVRTKDVDWTRQVLSAFGIDMTEAIVGPWTVLYYEPKQWRDEYADITGLIWLGFGCASESAKHRAVFLAELAASYYSKGNQLEAIQRLERALKAYPPYRHGAIMLANWLEEQGRSVEAAVWRERCEKMWRPDVAADVSFGGRAALKGVSLSQVNVSPGESIELEYYWTSRPENSARRLVVFVHFKRGKEILFQDDRRFLQDEDVVYQPFREVFVEKRKVVVPYGVESGEVEVWIGVYDTASGNNRLPVRTSLQASRRSVLLPFVLKIR